MDVIGYLRVSTNEQADSGLGLRAQEEAIRSAVLARKNSLIDLVIDPGASGKSMKRPGLERAIQMLEAGQAEALMVSKLDRLSRSILDFVTLMDQARRSGWALVALDLGVDTSTPQGEVLANVMASFAQFERRLISQRTKEALAVLKSQGVTLGRPRSLPDPVVRSIVRQRTRGMTFQAIADALNKKGVPTGQGGAMWHPATVRKVVLSATA